MIQSIGTYLPVWGTKDGREPGDDEDSLTLAVAAGLNALSAASPASAASITSVDFVTRELPLLQGGNSAALLAGLGLPLTVPVREQSGGAPAVLQLLAAAPTGTLVVASDIEGGAGAAAAVIGEAGAEVVITGRIERSLPVSSRGPTGEARDYGDPRLLRELGVRVSLDRAGVAGKVAAVAGLRGREAKQLCMGEPPTLPTVGGSAALFALASIVERGEDAELIAVEQATVAAATVSRAAVSVVREELPVLAPLALRPAAEADISLSLAAYERAFEEKLGLLAGRCTACGTLAYPTRFRCISCGSEDPSDLVPLPREAQVYTTATIHVPVPGLRTPYTLVLAELGDTNVRLLGKLTGAPPGSVAIADRGRMVLRRVAVRMGIPDYGYAFLPDDKVVAA